MKTAIKILAGLAAFAALTFALLAADLSTGLEL